MKKVGLVMLIILAILCLFPVTEAKIFLEDPLSLYNLGQKITLMPRILPAGDFSGYFKLVLICNELGTIKEQIIYFSPITLEENKEKQFEFSFQIMTKGACYFEASLQNTRYETVESEKTKSFTATDLININLEINKFYFFPEEELRIKGNVIKASGEAFEGPIIIKIKNITLSSSVITGKIDYKYSLPSDISSGEKEIIISVEDVYNNKGTVSEIITIASVPTNLLIETSQGTQENPNMFIPGSVITIKATLLDQSQKIMNENITLRIEGERKIVHEEIISSNEVTIYKLNKDLRAGEYNLKVSSQGIESEKLIYLAELKEITIEIENNTLHVINIGNVPYQESLEITFSQQGFSEIKLVDIDLDVGQETFIKLEAPTGEYEINIDGKTLHETLTFEGVPLTGKVTAAVELEQGFSFKDMVVFALIVMILAIAILLFVSKMRRESSGKVRHKNLYSKGIKESKQERQEQEKVEEKTKYNIISLGKREERQRIEEEIETKTGKISLASEKSKERLLREKSFLHERDDEFSQAVKRIFQQHSQKTGAKAVIPSLIFGDKRPITALFVRINGIGKLDTLRKKSPNTFEKILNDYFSILIDKIRTHQGVAEIYGNTIFIIFNAIKQYSHDLAAIKAASDIRDETIKFNEKYKDIAEFHVASGINTGNAFLSTIGENKILKYLPAEDTTHIAKQLEQRADNDEIIISENTYDRVKNTIDVKKLTPLFLSREKAIESYIIEKVGLRAKHKDYIDRVVREYKKQKQYS